MDVGSFPKRLDSVGMPSDVFINHIHVVYPAGSYAVQIAPAICYAVSNHKAVLAIQRTIRAKVSYDFLEN
jgi:hypothetical protein